MPKDVVAVLEIVDIDERHGNGGVLLPELLEGTGKAATVAKPSKLVGKGSPDQIFLPLEKVYGYEPIPAALNAEQARHVLGAQCQLWTEYIPNPQHLEYMAFPRLCALAEVTWSPAARKDYADFNARLRTHLARLDVIGVNYRPL